MKYSNKIYDNIPLSCYLAFQRLIPRSKSSQASMLLPKLAFLSIMIGVAASILILSLANGLQENYITRLAEQDAHISVVSVGRGIPAFENIIEEVKKVPGVVNAYPYTQNEALLKSYDETKGIILRGFPESFTNDSHFNNMFKLESGVWSFDKPRSITIGKSLADNYSLFLDESIDILAYDDLFGSTTYRFKIVGIFSSTDSLLNSSVGFITLKDATEIFGTKGYTQYIGIRVEDFNKVEQYNQTIKPIVRFNTKTWRYNNLNTLLALENEKKVIQVLLIIFFCVAFFGILSVITALVAEKREEIALLKALGMNHETNFRSFVLTGLFLGLGASLTGILLGVFLSLNFNNLIHIIESLVNNVFIPITTFITQRPYNSKFTFLNQSVYYLKEFPILIKYSDIIFSCSAAMICSILAAIYPAIISENYRPAEILRRRAG